MTAKTLLTLALCLSSLQADARPTEAIDYSAIYDDCIAAAGTTNNGVLMACAEGASTEAKKEIDLLYARLHKRYVATAPADAAKLARAQKAWLSYRDDHCALAGDHVGSPMYGFCPMQMNIKRVRELRELLGD